MSNETLVMVLGLAVAIDVMLGDPPNRFHPVAWMGNAIARARRAAPQQGNVKRFIYGGLFLVMGFTTVGLIGWAIDRGCTKMPVAVAVVVQALVLKSTFSVRSLSRAGRAVAEPLRRDDLAGARYQVSYHLVSRDVSQLDSAELSAATIESIAENTSDSVVAPLFFFAVAGLPGALVYRFVNTCDAMWGYRTPELEWLGKASARLDDLLNLVPARLTAMVMVVFGGLYHQRFAAAVRIWFRDRALTASPNAGHPMSAAAGVLGVSLEKKGHYLLGSGLRLPDVNDIDRAVRLLWVTAVVSVAVVIGLRFVIFGGVVRSWLGGDF